MNRQLLGHSIVKSSKHHWYQQHFRMTRCNTICLLVSVIFRHMSNGTTHTGSTHCCSLSSDPTLALGTSNTLAHSLWLCLWVLFNDWFSLFERNASDPHSTHGSTASLKKWSSASLMPSKMEESWAILSI